MATISKRGNSYRIRCSMGYDQKGKQIVKTMTWQIPEGMSAAKAEKEAQREAALFEEKVLLGITANGKIKFADFADKWFTDYAETQLRPKTIERYKSLMERINPAIGHIYLDKLRPGHLTELYMNLAQEEKIASYTAIINLKSLLKTRGITKIQFAELAGVHYRTIDAVYAGDNITPAPAQKIAEVLGMRLSKVFRPSGKPVRLSSKTILHHHRLISIILHTAVQWQYIPANPAERVKPPRVGRTEAEYLDDEQAIHLLELLEDQPIYYRTAIAVLLFTGMRRGELLGLTWNDVNFDKQLISVRRTLQYLPERGVYVDETKTYSSNRVIKAPLSAMEYLKEYQIWQRKEFFKVGMPWSADNHIFTTSNGVPMHPDTLTGWFGKFIKATNLPPIHIHSLRHTNATLQIANGVSITTVAGRLGHADATTTSKVYAHAIQSAEAAAAEVLEDLLRPKKNSPLKTAQRG